MRRRTLITGLAGLFATGTAVVGSGALDAVAADRTVSLRVADDDRSLLALSQLGDGSDPIGGRSNAGGTPETVSVSLPEVGRRVADPELGLGTDSVYEFDGDAGETGPDAVEGLVRIANQGTTAVAVVARDDPATELVVELYDVTDETRTALRADPVSLAPGEAVDVGLRVRTFDTPIRDFDERLTVVADSTG